MMVAGKKVDHCVQATGIKASKESGWWKIRNSWGSDWGEAGYIRIGYGYDCCGITDSATYSSTRLVHYTADDDDKNADDQSRRDDK
jgi:C1A family cysteine protease